MQKQILVAFILSWLILVGYHNLFIKKPVTPEMPAELYLQQYDNKQVIDGTPVVEKQVYSNQENPVEIEGQNSIVENANFKIVTNNKNGQIQALYLNKYDYEYPVTSIANFKNKKNIIYKINEEDKKSVNYEYLEKLISYKKTFSIMSNLDSFLIQVKIKNLSTSIHPINDQLILFSINFEDNKLAKVDAHEKSLNEYSYSINGNVIRKNNAFKFSEKDAKQLTGNFDWVGFRNRYYCFVVKPTTNLSQLELIPDNSNSLDFVLPISNLNLAPNEEINLNFKVYVGPQDQELLSKFDKSSANIIAFSGFSLFDFVAKMSVHVLSFFYKILHNWGFSIILIGILVYALTYPLTMRGMLSMKKMQKLQPKISQLRTQHQSNPQKLNKEIMELYKEHKVNPFGGCLPVILQMPIFFGLYQALWRSFNFKNAHFLWIKDLSQPDRLFLLPFNLPFLGNEINILPIFMGIAMFFQQKFSSKNMVITDASQEMQQKLMQVIFPFFIVFIFYKFSSGIALYFTVFYSLSTFTQWKMTKIN